MTIYSCSLGDEHLLTQGAMSVPAAGAAAWLDRLAVRYAVALSVGTPISNGYGAKHDTYTRLGISAVARLWLEQRGGDGSIVRPARLQRTRQLPGAEIAQQPGPLVFLHDACGRV